MSNSRKLMRILLNIVLPLTGIGLVIWLAPKVIYFFMPFVIGGVIALIANPLVRFLEHKIRIRRKFGMVLIIGGVLALVIGGIYLLLAWIVREVGSFIGALPDIMKGVSAQMEIVAANLEETLRKLPNVDADWNLLEALQNFSTDVTETLTGLVANLGMPTVTAAGNIAKSLPDIFVKVFITILSAYFFLAEKEQVAAVYRSVMPKKTQEVLHMISRNAKQMVGGYFLAQFRIMGVVAVMLFVGFLILRVPYAAIWAFLIAFLDLLPVFGTGTALIPWALIQLLSGKYYMAIGLVACWLSTQAVRQMIQPKIVGDSMGVDPLLTLLLLYLGYRFSGLGGMILAVPVGLIVMELYKYGLFDSLTGGIRDLVRFVRELRGQTDTEDSPAKSRDPLEQKPDERDMI